MFTTVVVRTQEPEHLRSHSRTILKEDDNLPKRRKRSVSNRTNTTRRLSKNRNRKEKTWTGELPHTKTWITAKTLSATRKMTVSVNPDYNHVHRSQKSERRANIPNDHNCKEAEDVEEIRIRQANPQGGIR